MLDKFKFEVKSEEEAQEKIKAELGKDFSELYVQKFETEAKLFKSKKIVFEVIKKEDVISFVKEFIKSTVKLMGIEVQLEIKETDGIINIIMASDNNPILIGKEGRTLNSLQILIRQTLSTQTEMNIKVNLDASNYKGKKLKNLEYDIKRVVYDVLRTHGEVHLDPMNSYERRFIHNMVSEFKELSSNSEGEGTTRHIVIRYIGE
jgi:spoIIIJ-associated protein